VLIVQAVFLLEHVQRDKGQDHTVTKTVAVASDHGWYSATQYATVLPAAVAGVCLHVDATAYVFQL